MQLAPGVGAGDALRAEPLFGPWHVAGGVGWLHRCDQTQFSEATQIIRRQHLRVLDPPAMVASGIVAQDFGVAIQHDLVATVADRMSGNLYATTLGLGLRCPQSFWSHRQDTAIAAFIAVVFAHRRTTTA